MRTRSGYRYQLPDPNTAQSPRRKKPRPWVPAATKDYFGRLPDDLVILILSQLSASDSSRPSDLASVIVTCNRMRRLGRNRLVLASASANSLAIRAANWCEDAHRFLKMCIAAGNFEASYILGMIHLYCLGNRPSGMSLMARAARKSHARAIYSLAIVQFNGSGGTRADMDRKAGVSLLIRSAALGHAEGLRELGHCLVDGYGVRKNLVKGREFLLQATAKEEAAGGSTEPHPANRFLLEWFAAKPVASWMRMCMHPACGRPETRKHEFRRCSVCGKVQYCSRGCQSLHWKMAHRAQCVPATLAEQQAMMRQNDEAEAAALALAAAAAAAAAAGGNGDAREATEDAASDNGEAAAVAED